MRERIEAMKAIWTEAKPEYHGEFVNFPPMMTWPKPVQKPYPPIIVVGAFPHAARAALRRTGGSRSPVADPMGCERLLPKFKQMVREAGATLRRCRSPCSAAPRISTC